MEEAARKALVAEILFYITAALVTFLALVISFKWVYRKTVRRRSNVCPVHPSGSNKKSMTKDKSLQACSGKGDGGDVQMREDSIPEEGEDGDDDDDDDIRDLLINHDDIKPVGEVPTEGPTDLTAGSEDEDIETKTQHLAGPQKTKKLVEEVAKRMSDEQKAEERRIQSEQLEAIFNLVQNQQDTFGIGSLQDIQDQFKLYA